MRVAILLLLLAVCFADDTHDLGEQETDVEYHATTSAQKLGQATDAKAEENAATTATNTEEALQLTCDSLVPNKGDQLKHTGGVGTCGKITCFDSDLCSKCKAVQLGNNDCELGSCKTGDLVVDGVNRCEGVFGETTSMSGKYCKSDDDVDGLLVNNDCCVKEECCSLVPENMKTQSEFSVGQESSSGSWDPQSLKVSCGPYNSYDYYGMDTCHNLINMITMLWPTQMEQYRCYVGAPQQGMLWNPNYPYGTCDCLYPYYLSTDARCHLLTCQASTNGPDCLTCANPLTRNNECASCNDGYILDNGDCLSVTCTEDPDDWEWQGCQECRVLDSRRHPEDCLICANGYHHLHEQRNLPNATDSVVYSAGSLVVQGQESGYCFPYACVAGGNLVDANSADGDFQAPNGIPLDPYQRAIKITPIVSTENGKLDASVPALDPQTLAFRDHCRTCVPQQKRLKNDHCETCNPGYYLDEMHHTCRKKTCGVPHFRRNAVSCTDEHLFPLPWSTPCTECLDNSVGDDGCCVERPPEMTCGGQGVFCAKGTYRENYHGIDCSEDGCKHFSESCCAPKSCLNQQVSCHRDQDQNHDYPLCNDCLMGGSECCNEKETTCGLKNVQCGPTQHFLGAETGCTICANEGDECCSPMQKTCQNQGVFCHAGTHKQRTDVATVVTCSDCEHYGEECCDATTCLNQRVSCAANREHKGEEKCEDCIDNTDECCEPAPPIADTCGNQFVKCEPRLYKPFDTACDTEEDTCNDYGLTCCEQKKCGNQEVGCSVLQAKKDSETECVNCADGGEECCDDHKTCGLTGVQCKLGGYKPTHTKCTDCEHFGTECCVEIAKTCTNQGVVCHEGTHMALGTACTDCKHYGSDCCNARTCGNQNIGCSLGKPRKGDDPECGDACHHDSTHCCDDLVKTCSAMGVKCHDGHYLPDQATTVCGDSCTNYQAPCCTPFKNTCGNQKVKCSKDQTYAAASVACNLCQNYGSECCPAVDKTCKNQNVVCRPGHAADDYATQVCGDDCQNDAEPCCKPYVKTCGSENVVCAADQTYLLPTSGCTKCENNEAECCEDIAPTCANKRVVCRSGHYHPDYATKGCEGCKNDDTAECCVAFVTTCGNQNVQCNSNQVPKDPQTVCDGADQCKHNSATCCTDVDQTCGNQAVVCRPGHYVNGYKDVLCGEQGCLNDVSPCCQDYKETCGNQNIKCHDGQTYKGHDTLCNGSCEHYSGVCCIEVADTCANQGVICRPGYYVDGFKDKACGDEGCAHHSAPCCTKFEKTCGNQDVVCKAGQTYKVSTTVCDDCENNMAECCDDIDATCKNQQVVCRPGHYVDDWATKACTDCMYDGSECCKAHIKTCGNQNVKCSPKHDPKDASTPCDGDGCNNDSTTCCIPITATCANENVVCRPGHYEADYQNIECASTGCQNDQAPCCKAFVKTCQNQGVICTLGLMKHSEIGSLECDSCNNYDTKECCEEITKTCGNSGQACRQDLHKPVDTACTHCGVSECCEPIPDPVPTCSNQKHECESMYYKPGEVVCPDGKCTDDICCHHIPVTCSNQNVQCHVGTYKEISQECTNCLHYGEECCVSQTCATVGVTCDSRMFRKANDYDTMTCEGVAGCTLEKDSLPCCVDKAGQGTTPSCGNKYGIDETSLTDWPFMSHFGGMLPVVCDANAGWYPRVGADGKPLAGEICGHKDKYTKENMWTACQTNDIVCCWRKTCASNDNVANGMNNGGEGQGQDEFTTHQCKDGYQLKERPEYIVCQGDCHLDCCDKIPDAETCKSARVGCSYGYERKQNWDTIECGENCVENSDACCKRTDCTNVECHGTKQEHKGGALCFECKNMEAECCDDIPEDMTCSNQRVHCSYKHYKIPEYEGKVCTNCYEDGDECCTPKTCGNRGITAAVTCDEVNFAHKDAATKCENCVDNGAECCDPIPPSKTCGNQMVSCGFGKVYADLKTGCEDCLDDGEECCVDRTCGDVGTGAGAQCGEGLDAKHPETKCTLCMDHHEECCTKQETCWTSKVVCPKHTYHKHPNLICGDNCSEETCCAIKTCENQGVCCNSQLGFSEVAGFQDMGCSNCADNCEECCSFDTPTCGSANVGCGFGFHRKNGVDNEDCTTCSLNDPECCEPRTCGADLDIDEAYTCPETHNYNGDGTPCHFCQTEECCTPKTPMKTCRSENINCGIGMKRVVESDDKDCSTCVQNDEVCCEPMKCGDMRTCDDGFENKGDVLCSLCHHDECCDKVPTCASAAVGCGFSMNYSADQTTTCSTCQHNDPSCCSPKTCASEAFACPDGFESVANTDKACAFCELSECCQPIVPTKTCSSESVGCGHGWKKLPEYGADTPCGLCELNNEFCCGQKQCTEEDCPAGFHRKSTNLECGFCSVEECCDADVPAMTCHSEKVGCGFGMKQITDVDREVTECSTCAHNDGHCCEAKTCGDDGPNCADVTNDLGTAYTEKGAMTTCTDCGVSECCVPPVIQKTCMNQGIMCSGSFDKHDDYHLNTCEDCVHNGEECCVYKTCGSYAVDCAADLYTKVDDHETKKCVLCNHNGMECCNPKICGTHFFDKEFFCDEATHSSKARNQACVNCDESECCTPNPELKCAEIEIPHGQAFYTAPDGPGSERTLGSILSVECDLGYKFQDSEYAPSTNENSRNQDVTVVDYPVCFPELIKSWIEGHVEVFSPTTSGWNRAPPVCRPVTCPPLQVQSKFTPDAPTKWDIGTMLYVDAQMDDVPMRGAGYGPRDYAGEADVTCNEGWIRVPNICATGHQDGDGNDDHTENTLEYALKGFWRMENDLQDSSPHCLDSSATEGGTCNPGTMVGGSATYSAEGAEINGQASPALVLNGVDQYVRVDDSENDYKPWNGNELNIDGNQWTTSVFAYLDPALLDNDAFMFARYTSDFDEIVSIRLSNGYICAVYNDGSVICAEDAKMPTGRWVSIVVRMDGEKIDIFVDGVLKRSEVEDAKIADTEQGHVFIGADQDPTSGEIEGFFTGLLDEVRYYTRGISDEEVQCIAQGKTTCSAAAYYAKPYNTQGCNRPSEEIQSAEECRQAINELLQDSILGNSLNGGKRFGRTIQDDQKSASYDNVPAKCSYREEDAQIIFNPDANGRAHTSLSPICKTNPTGTDLETLGCLPKCLSNGKWSVEAPTCEKDWCHPIFEEWSCCENRLEEKSQTYWLNYHKQDKPLCPVNYGDCDHDSDCSQEHHAGLCSQRRDLDNIDVCIVDLDPCGGVKGATGPLCVVMTAVGMDYHAHAEAGLASNLFIGGAVLVLGSLAGYYMCKEKKGEEHRALLEEEL